MFALLAGNTLTTRIDGNVVVRNSPGATVIIGSIVGNQVVAAGGPFVLSRSAADR